MLAVARLYWSQSGLVNSEDLTRLDDVTIEIADMPGLLLGRSEGSTILLDSDAAGYGWFIDRTPGQNEEFHRGGSDQTLWLARNGNDAAGHIDLLTVIEHELGHILGFDHVKTGLMKDDLQAGERKLVAEHFIDTSKGNSVDLSGNSHSPEQTKTAPAQKELINISYFDEYFGAFKYQKSEPDAGSSLDFMIFTDDHENAEEESRYLLKQEDMANDKQKVLTEEEAETEEIAINTSALIDWSVGEE